MCWRKSPTPRYTPGMNGHVLPSRFNPPQQTFFNTITADRPVSLGVDLRKLLRHAPPNLSDAEMAEVVADWVYQEVKMILRQQRDSEGKQAHTGRSR
jgi:hypothetical protein